MSKQKNGVHKVDIVKFKSLQELRDYAETLKADSKLKETNKLFDHFIETGEVLPIPKNKINPTQALCRGTRIKTGIHQQMVRKMSMPKKTKGKIIL